VEAAKSSPLLEWANGTGVVDAAGEAVRYCIQCGTCSAVCPVSEYMEYSPRQINALLLAGQWDELLRSKSIWFCTGCYACTVACPMQFPITESIAALKRESVRRGLQPRRFPTAVMARVFVALITRWGRISETWASVALYLQTRPEKLLQNVPLSIRLLRRGRLRIRPESVRERAQLRRMLDSFETTAGLP